MARYLEIIRDIDLPPFLGLDIDFDNEDPPGEDFVNMLKKGTGKNIAYDTGDATITLPRKAKNIKEYVDYISNIVRVIKDAGYNWYMATWHFYGPEPGQSGIIHASPEKELITVIYDDPDGHKLVREKYRI